VINDFPTSKSQEDIRQKFEIITQIVDLEVKYTDDGKRYCFIEVSSLEGFKKILAHDKNNWEECVISIRRPAKENPVERMVYVSQLPLQTN
jgi:hypothetical protein